MILREAYRTRYAWPLGMVILECGTEIRLNASEGGSDAPSLCGLCT